MKSSSSKVDQNGDYEGLKLEFDKNSYMETKEIRIHGALSMFINCGSQYAIWHQFPNSIRYILKDLDSGEIYQSVNMELSISWDGNDIYEQYSKEPCDKIIEKEYSILLNDIYFIDSPKKIIKNFELNSNFMNFVSNILSFKDIPVEINGF